MSQYRTGTVFTINGSAAITGSGTVWLSEVGPGDLFTVDGLVVYQVGSVVSDTQLNLTAPYAGSTQSNVAYSIFRDFTANYGWPYPNKGDVETASIVKAALVGIDGKLQSVSGWMDKAAPAGAVVGTTDIQTLTNKTLGATALPGGGQIDATGNLTWTGQTALDKRLTFYNAVGVQRAALAYDTTMARVKLVDRADAPRWVFDEPGGILCLGGDYGSEGLRVVPISAAVNYLRVNGNGVGIGPLLRAEGASSNLTVYYETKGMGTHEFRTGSGGPVQLVIWPVASAVNCVYAQGGVTGGSVHFGATGGDANAGLVLSTKGAGEYIFFTSVETQPQFKIGNAVSAVNYWAFFGSSAGASLVMQASGADADVGYTCSTKGVGLGLFTANGHPALMIYNSGGAGANYFKIGQGGTGQPLYVRFEGSDANISGGFLPKGAGLVNLYDSNGLGRVSVNTSGVGFHGASPIAKPTITGSRGGNAALTSLLTALAAYGLLTDSTST